MIALTTRVVLTTTSPRPHPRQSVHTEIRRFLRPEGLTPEMDVFACTDWLDEWLELNLGSGVDRILTAGRFDHTPVTLRIPRLFRRDSNRARA